MANGLFLKSEGAHFMYRKSDKTRIKERRGCGEGQQYQGFLAANEARSRGSAAQFYDPIENRTVDLMSQGELLFYAQLRFNPAVKEIKEQYPMYNQRLIADICVDNGFNPYYYTRFIMSTDFLVTMWDGRRIAYSVKANRQQYTDKSKSEKRIKEREKFLKRQFIEYEYWKRQGVQFQTVIKTEINRILSINILHILHFYNWSSVHDGDSLFKYLIAHHKVTIDMAQYLVEFSNEKRKYGIDFDKLFQIVSQKSINLSKG